MTAMTVILRPPDPDTDVAAIVAMQAQAFSYLIQTPQFVEHLLRTKHSEAESLSLVAEVAGAVVGYATTKLDKESSLAGAASGGVLVDTHHQRQGIGTQLFDALAECWQKIGATTITARLASDDAAAFAIARGFALSRTERISHVSLSEVPAPLPAPAGIHFVPLCDLDDVYPLYVIDSAVTQDIPADEPWEALSFEEWSKIYPDDPRLDRNSTVLAFDGDKVVGLAWLDSADTRVWSGLTGTLREYRGRGLAKAMKTVALHRARERGAVDAYTNNDSANAGMLAVNTWLGYRPHLDQYVYTRVLS